MTMKVTMGEKEVDLEASWPLTIKDMKALKAAGVTDAKGEIDTGDPDRLSKMLLHLFKKVDDTITVDDVDEIDIIQVKAIGDWIDNKTREAGFDRPT